jgi:hypothetical protein
MAPAGLSRCCDTAWLLSIACRRLLGLGSRPREEEAAEEKCRQRRKATTRRGFALRAVPLPSASDWPIRGTCRGASRAPQSRVRRVSRRPHTFRICHRLSLHRPPQPVASLRRWLGHPSDAFGECSNIAEAATRARPPRCAPRLQAESQCAA